MLCPFCRSRDQVRKDGTFPRKTGAKPRTQRFYCRACQRRFSQLTGCLDSRQRRPELHRPLYSLLVSGVSQRRTARLLGTTQTTVARKVVRIAKFARSFHEGELRRSPASVSTAVFDEMETFEHSKLKPLAIAVAVVEGSRKIIAVSVSSMPAKGKLAATARRRYGHRPDHRRQGLAHVLTRLSAVGVAEGLVVKSDQCPRYPRAVRRYVSRALHLTFKGRRACVVGQGELKVGGFDPLFALNHTCAMHRDNVKRLSRRTWCTTKRPDRLQCLIDLYICAHNDDIELKRRKRRGQCYLPFLAIPAPAEM